MPENQLDQAQSDIENYVGIEISSQTESGADMGGKLEEIRKLREKISAGQLSADEAEAEMNTVKSRIVGVLIEDARKAQARSIEDVSEILNVPTSEYRAFETGEKSPTLPQLEVLAYYFNVPISHLMGGNTLRVERNEEQIREQVADVLMLRQRVIGVRLRQLREEGGRTVKQVAEESGLTEEAIKAVEAGQIALPLNELESLTQAIRANLEDLMDGHGPIGEFVQSQREFDAFTELPTEMREFILKRINRTYLDLAIRMSQMEVGRLRGIAESILEITH